MELISNLLKKLAWLYIGNVVLESEYFDVHKGHNEVSDIDNTIDKLIYELWLDKKFVIILEEGKEVFEHKMMNSCKF